MSVALHRELLLLLGVTRVTPGGHLSAESKNDFPLLTNSLSDYRCCSENHARNVSNLMGGIVPVGEWTRRHLEGKGMSHVSLLSVVVTTHTQDLGQSQGASGLGGGGQVGTPVAETVVMFPKVLPGRSRDGGHRVAR